MTPQRPYSALANFAVLCVVLALSTPARAWDPFRSESRDVNRGNEHLQKGQHAEALEAYDTAARKLPRAAGVQLNRGLALMATDKLGPAREAFKLATQGSAPKDVRAQAYYDMGLAFLREAESEAKAEKLDGAQGFLREAVDAFKSSLRNGPKNGDAAWNLELAKRRLVEMEKQQKEKKEQEKKEQEKKDEQKENEQKEDEQQDQQDGDKQSDDKQGDNEPQKKPGDQDESKRDKPDDPQQPGPNQEPKQEKPEPKQDAESPSEGDKGEQPQQALPKPMQEALDALAHGEENLEKLRARMRAARQPQRVQKDW